MGLRDGLSKLSGKFAKYAFIGAVITGGHGAIKQEIARHSINSIDEGQKAGALIEDAPKKRAEAVQEYEKGGIIGNYGGELLGHATGLGLLSLMFSRRKKEEEKQPNGGNKAPAPTP